MQYVIFVLVCIINYDGLPFEDEVGGIFTIPPTLTVPPPPCNPLTYSVCAPGMYVSCVDESPFVLCGLLIILFPVTLFVYRLRA